jgi:hypothetical protein
MTPLKETTVYVEDAADSNYWLAEVTSEGEDYKLKTPLQSIQLYCFTKDQLWNLLSTTFGEGYNNVGNLVVGNAQLNYLIKLLP